MRIAVTIIIDLLKYFKLLSYGRLLLINKADLLTLTNCEHLSKELKRKGVTLQLLWEEYCQANAPNYYSRSHFYAIYRDWCKKRNVVMRQQHKAGDKLFIDYSGDKVSIMDRNTGELISAEIFVAVLGASTFTYAEATLSQNLPDWIASNIRAFEFFGGVPNLLVPDYVAWHIIWLMCPILLCA